MIQFRGSAITSDGGLLAYRELDDALALTASGGERLAEALTGKNRRHFLVGLLRQSVFGRLAGYEDVNDPIDYAATRQCGWSAARRQWAGLPRPARWGASRPSGWCGRTTLLPSPTCRASGSTRCTSGASRRSSCWTWIRAIARPTANRRVALTTAISGAPAIIRSPCQPAWRSGALRPAARKRPFG